LNREARGDPKGRLGLKGQEEPTEKLRGTISLRRQDGGQPLSGRSIGGATTVMNSIVGGTHPGENIHFRVRIEKYPPALPHCGDGRLLLGGTDLLARRYWDTATTRIPPRNVVASATEETGITSSSSTIAAYDALVLGTIVPHRSSCRHAEIDVDSVPLAVAQSLLLVPDRRNHHREDHAVSFLHSLILLLSHLVDTQVKRFSQTDAVLGNLTIMDEIRDSGEEPFRCPFPCLRITFAHWELTRWYQPEL
jgi:hypothetical protein